MAGLVLAPVLEVLKHGVELVVGVALQVAVDADVAPVANLLREVGGVDDVLGLEESVLAVLGEEAQVQSEVEVCRGREGSRARGSWVGGWWLCAWLDDLAGIEAATVGGLGSRPGSRPGLWWMSLSRARSAGQQAWRVQGASSSSGGGFGSPLIDLLMKPAWRASSRLMKPNNSRMSGFLARFFISA